MGAGKSLTMPPGTVQGGRKCWEQGTRHRGGGAHALQSQVSPVPPSLWGLWAAALQSSPTAKRPQGGPWAARSPILPPEVPGKDRDQALLLSGWMNLSYLCSLKLAFLIRNKRITTALQSSDNSHDLLHTARCRKASHPQSVTGFV